MKLVNAAVIAVQKLDEVRDALAECAGVKASQLLPRSKVLTPKGHTELYWAPSAWLIFCLTGVKIDVAVMHGWSCSTQAIKLSSKRINTGKVATARFMRRTCVIQLHR